MDRRIAGVRRSPRRIIERTRELGRRRRRVVVGLGSVAAVACLVLIACDTNATLDAAARTTDRLEETRAQLHRTQDDLSSTLDSVDVNRTELAGAIKTRILREAERSHAQGTYNDTTAWLQALQAQLDTANANLAASTDQLGALQTCVGGVTEALNAASAGDTAGMARTVRGIEGVCAQAGVDL